MRILLPSVLLKSTVRFRASPVRVFRPVCMPEHFSLFVVEHGADFFGLAIGRVGADLDVLIAHLGHRRQCAGEVLLGHVAHRPHLQRNGDLLGGASPRRFRAFVPAAHMAAAPTPNFNRSRRE